jgi:hypothetical protein
MIVVDTDSNEVYEWEADDGLGDRLAPSLPSYLERYRDELLEHHLEYIDGCGVVENVTKASRK